MAWSTEGQDQRAEATAALIDEISLHSGDPGGSGTDNEVSGNGYARLSPSFGSASSGAVTATPLDFDTPSEQSVNYIGLWDVGGNFLGSAQRTSGDSAANVAGEYTVNITLTASGTISA